MLAPILPNVQNRAATTLAKAGSAAAQAIATGRFGRSGEPRPSAVGRSPEQGRRETSLPVRPASGSFGGAIEIGR